MAIPDDSKRRAGSEEASVDVVYALPDQQFIVRLPFTPGLTAGEACRRSGLAARFSDAVTGPLVLGVHGARVDHTFRLRPGDRVEICRPLVADPRRMRVDLVSAGKVMGRNKPETGN